MLAVLAWCGCFHQERHLMRLARRSLPRGCLRWPIRVGDSGLACLEMSSCRAQTSGKQLSGAGSPTCVHAAVRAPQCMHQAILDELDAAHLERKPCQLNQRPQSTACAGGPVLLPEFGHQLVPSCACQNPLLGGLP